MPPQHSSWPALLDALEEQLRRQGAALRDGTEPPPPVQLPGTVGGIPAELAPRAIALLDRCRDLEALVAAETRRRRPATRSYGPGGHELGRL
jgi:hypothetical protein